MTAYTDARALELLLSVIVYPHNSYCIHLDPKVAQCSNFELQSVCEWGYLVKRGTHDPKVVFPICLIVASCLVSCHPKCQASSAKSLVSQSHKSVS